MALNFFFQGHGCQSTKKTNQTEYNDVKGSIEHELNDIYHLYDLEVDDKNTVTLVNQKSKDLTHERNIGAPNLQLTSKRR